MNQTRYYGPDPARAQVVRKARRGWSRRILLVGWLAVGLGLTATACSSPTAPPLPEEEKEEPKNPPEEG